MASVGAMGASAVPEPLPESLIRDLRGLGAGSSAPSAGDSIEWLQTHISHLLLSNDRVVKIRKAVDLGFLDFGTREARNQDCLCEVALNRRLAPDVYLGVAPILRGPGGWRLGPVAETLGGDCEHAVVMRRLPEGTDALSRLRSGTLGNQDLEAAAELLARFHAAHELDANRQDRRWRERVEPPMRACIASLQGSGVVPKVWVDEVDSRWRHTLAVCHGDFDRRAGRIVDGHGDVRLEHLWFEGPSRPPLLIDCVEFDPALRRIDPASEVAFLAMDLRHRGRADLAEHFLASYAAASDDFGLYSVVDPYLAYRATVRAEVAALAARDCEIGASQQDGAATTAGSYVELARETLQPRGPGRVLLICGTVGTGKSTAARMLAYALEGAVVVSTDRTRRRLLSPTETDRYAAANIHRVYQGIYQRAAFAVGSGRTAILDATFSLRSLRSEGAAWAENRGVVPWLIRVDCPTEIARERLRLRTAEGLDPSEAGPERLGPSRASFEPPTEWPANRMITLDSSDPARLASAIESAARRIRTET